MCGCPTRNFCLSFTGHHWKWTVVLQCSLCVGIDSDMQSAIATRNLLHFMCATDNVLDGCKKYFTNHLYGPLCRSN